MALYEGKECGGGVHCHHDPICKTLDDYVDKVMHTFEPSEAVIEATEAADMVKHPSHYDVLPGVEAKHIIEAQLTRLYGKDAYRAYCHGNMLKYLLRKKFDIDEDVAKTGRYSEMYLGDDK